MGRHGDSLENETTYCKTKDLPFSKTIICTYSTLLRYFIKTVIKITKSNPSSNRPEKCRVCSTYLCP